jgi:hypothetical protein
LLPPGIKKFDNWINRDFSHNFDKKYNMQNIVITPKSKQSAVFLKKLLSNLKDVKRFEIVEENKEVPFVVLTESSLEKEWSSEEDDIWDNWAKEKLKIAR